ncbi:MAG TPA: dTDP-4-dehydrorhamnose reductase [Sphingobacterium sp.]|nr:dTDP-4-dehydrorhamnose reductase [Sphingobacterium sp.]
MRIVITGANGQLGSELRHLWRYKEGYECFFLDRKQLPLDQIMIIQDILGMYQPELIVHAGAYTAVDKAEVEVEQAEIINYLATEEIAQSCRLNGCKLLAISTGYVFDGNSKLPLSEDAAVSPINTYGLTKLKGEQAIQKWWPESIIIRTSWVYSGYGNNFVKTMLRLMREREEISVIDDQIGSPTSARDLARAIGVIVDSGTWEAGIYHYSNEGKASWYEFAIAIRDAIGLTCKINSISTAEYPTPAKRPKYSLLDKSKIKRVYGLEIPHWKDSLRAVIGSFTA